MTSPPTSEPAQVAADSPLTACIERMTRMAEHFLEVPQALISLTDHRRTRFEERMGPCGNEVRPEVSFCAHAILGDGLFIVEDALADARFRDSVVVTGDPRVRFYAGYPLRGWEDQHLGTLAILDQKPRTLTPTERMTLRDLASVVETELHSLELDATDLASLTGRALDARAGELDEETGVCDERATRALLAEALGYCAEAGLPATLVAARVATSARLPDRRASGVVLAESAQALARNLRAYDALGRVEQGLVALLVGCAPGFVPARIEELRLRTGGDPALERLSARLELGFACSPPAAPTASPGALIEDAFAALERTASSGRVA